MGTCTSKDNVIIQQGPSKNDHRGTSHNAPTDEMNLSESGNKKDGGINNKAPNTDRPTSPTEMKSFEHSTSRVIPSGYSSGASTPRVNSFDDFDTVSDRRDKEYDRSSSLGLDKIIDERRTEGDLTNNIVRLELPFGKPIEEVYDGVHDGPILGSGLNGAVRLIKHKVTGAKYAVKCLELSLVGTEDGIRQLREEIAIMCQLDHPNIVRLEEVYESLTEIYLVQELCEGGELFDRLDEQPDYHYSEAQCARLVKQILSAVRYMHSKGVIHRDLKLENFLFSSGNADSELKMIDFGLSKHFKFGEVQREAVGTPYTVAPEVIRGCYDERCDIWAIGVITYLLLSGDAPFGGCGGPETLVQVRSNILNGHFKFEPEDVWSAVSSEAKDFIRLLLVTDPVTRPTAKECQRTPWLRKWSAKTRSLEGSKLNPNVVKALVGFKEYSKMRKLLCEVLSFTLLPDQITHLHKEFEKFDIDGSGEISLASLKRVLMQNAGSGSLGALSEKEVEEIFNAMRMRESETRIHWHEFIAAMLSQCKVDERNLRLAFDRLDHEHKGYITFRNLMDLMGRDAENKIDLQEVLGGSVGNGANWDVRITYDDFLLLMKGGSINSNATNHLQKSSLTEDYEFSTIKEEAEGDSEEDEKESNADDDTKNDTDVDVLSNDDEVFHLNHKHVDFITFRRTRSADAADETEDMGVTEEDPNTNSDSHQPKRGLFIMNRKGLAAQRKMRRAVRAAIKLFEDEQMKRAMVELSAKQDASVRLNYGAGLVMRHGLTMELTSESVRKVVKQRQEQQQLLLEKANERGGRGRRTRTKTKSDMSALLASIPPDEESTVTEVLMVAPVNSTLEIHEASHRKPTTPGQFKKTVDPFHAHGYLQR